MGSQKPNPTMGFQALLQTRPGNTSILKTQGSSRKRRLIPRQHIIPHLPRLFLSTLRLQSLHGHLHHPPTSPRRRLQTLQEVRCKMTPTPVCKQFINSSHPKHPSPLLITKTQFQPQNPHPQPTHELRFDHTQNFPIPRIHTKSRQIPKHPQNHQTQCNFLKGSIPPMSRYPSSARSRSPFPADSAMPSNCVRKSGPGNPLIILSKS